MPHDFRGFVAQQSQEDLLGYIIQVGDTHGAASDEELAQRRAPAAEPFRQGIAGRSWSHMSKTGSAGEPSPFIPLSG